MRLHEVQVRMAPVLWWAIAGTSSTTVTHVISTTVRVYAMVIPARDGLKTLGDSRYYSKKDRTSSLLQISPVSPHAFLLGAHVVSWWGESLPSTSVIIPVLTAAPPFPASVPLPGK